MCKKSWLPMGTRVLNESDSELTFEAPKDWIYVGISNGDLIQAIDGKTKISCTCIGTGSCNPFIATGPSGSTSGCAGDCTKCTTTRTISSTNRMIDEGGYLNLSLETRFVDLGETIPSAFNAMFSLEEVNSILTDFLNQIYSDTPYPNVTEVDGNLYVEDGYSFAIVSLCGRAISVAVPNEVLKVNNASGSSSNCSCTKGVCKKESQSVPLLGSVTYCVGGCSGTCTLTVSKIISNQLTLIFASEFFEY
jgi:hypothetical protein